MSISLLEVIEAAGYDLNNYDDAVWLLAQQNEFKELIEQAQDFIDDGCSICNASPMTANCNNARCQDN